MTPDRTSAAIQARRRATEQKLQEVRDAIAELRRQKTPLSYPAIARRAGVSRTFLYENPSARTLTSQAITSIASQRIQAVDEAAAGQEASWRERALNAEDALKAAHAEIRAQRARIWAASRAAPRRRTRPQPRHHPADHHREHLPQTARPPANRRQPDTGRTAASRARQQPVRRPAHRPARNRASRTREPR